MDIHRLGSRFYARCEQDVPPDAAGEPEPAWYGELVAAGVAELAIETEGAADHLRRARAAGIPPAFEVIAELIELRVAVRAAVPATLAIVIPRIEQLIAQLSARTPATSARACHLLAVASIRIGKLEAAEAAIAEALAVVDDEPGRVWMIDTLAQILIGQGAWHEGVVVLAALVERRRANRDAIGVAVSAGHLARLHLQLGRHDTAAAVARAALAQLPADAPTRTLLRLQTLVVEATHHDPEHGRELARLVALEAGRRHYLVGYAHLAVARALARSGDLAAAHAQLAAATRHALPPPALLRVEAVIDPGEVARAPWRSRFDAMLATIEEVTDDEVELHVFIAARAVEPAERRALLERAYARVERANNPLWLRRIDDTAAVIDRELHAERLARRFLGRSAAEHGRTVRDDVTVIFADLVEFTPRTLALPPDEVMDTVRGLFELGVPLMTRHRVEPIAYLGDGLLALCRDRDHEARGLAFARELVARAGRISTMRRHAGVAWPLDLRAGVASGPVVLGPLGSALKTDFAAIGIATNLAARLQSFAEPGEIVCAADTARLARVDAPTESLRVRGFETRGAIGVCRFRSYTPGARVL